MKRIILILCLLSMNCIAYANKYEDYGFEKFTSETHPILYKYIDDYARDLFYRFNPDNTDRCKSNICAYYIFKEGGKIEPGVYCDDDSKKFLSKYPPPPFPSGIETDKLDIDIIFETTVRTPYSKAVAAYPVSDTSYIIEKYKNIFDKEKIGIIISKDTRYHNMTKLKCIKNGYEWSSRDKYCKTKIEPFFTKGKQYD